MLLPGLPDRVEEAEAELHGAVELPAELADVGDPEGEAGHRPDGHLLRAHVAERLVRQVRLGERLEDLARRRAPEAEAGEA